MPLILHAYAKLNLTLEVLGKREDSYHEIRSVMQTVSLADTLSLWPDKEIKFSSDTEIPSLPHNLVLRAAELLKGEVGYKNGARLHLAKNIPIAAGLGGGSSDAAATLRGLNELWQLGLSREQLSLLAAKLGSDVAFFLYSGTALASGRGEKIAPLPPVRETWFVIFKPPIEIPNKTGSLYASLNPSDYNQGQWTQRMVESLMRSGRFEPSLIFNVFDRAAYARTPGLARYRDQFAAAGANNVHLAGSGPSLCTLADSREEGEILLNSLHREGIGAYLVSTVDSDESLRIEKRRSSGYLAVWRR